MADIKKQIIVGVNLDTGNAAQELDKVKGKLTEIDGVKLDKPFTSFKAAIKQAKIEAEQLAIAYEKGLVSEKVAADATKRLAKLKDAQDDFTKSVNAANPDNKLQPLIGVAQIATRAIQGVTAGMNLLGVESKSAEQAILTLQSLSAVADIVGDYKNLQDAVKNVNKFLGISNGLTKINNGLTLAASGIMKAFGVSVNTTATSFKVLKGAIAATGIGLLVVLIGELVSQMDLFGDSADTAADKQSKLNDELERQKKALDDIFSSSQREIERRINITKNEEEIKNLKARGASQEEINKLERENIKIKLQSLQVELLTKKDVLSTQEEFELKKQIFQQEQALKRIDIEEEKTRTDKFKESQKERTAELKRKADERNRIREDELNQIKKIEQEASDNILKARLNDRDRELFELDKDFKVKLALYRKYGKDVSTIVEENEIKRKGITQKYTDEINKTLKGFLDEGLPEFDQKVNEVNERFDNLLKNADANQKRYINNVRAYVLATMDANNQLTKEEEIRKKLAEKYNSDFIKKKPNNLDFTAQVTEINNKVTNEISGSTNDNSALAIKNRKDAAAKELADDKAKKDALAANEADFQANVTAIQEAGAESRKAIKQAELDFILNTTSDILGSVSDIVGRDTVAGKALAIAQGTISATLAGINAFNAIKTAKTPAEVLAAVALSASVVAKGMALVKQIKNVKVPTKNGAGGSGGNIPNISAPQITATSTASQQVQDVRVTNQNQQPLRAFIVDRDLVQNEEKRNFLNQVSTF